MEQRGPVDGVLTAVAWALIGFGVATWAVSLTIFEPALSALVDPHGIYSQGVDFDDIDILAAYLVRLPWTSILVGVAGGLLMLRRSRLRGRLGWGLVLGWVAVDIVLDWLDVAGPVAAIVVGALGAVIVVGVVIVGAQRTGPSIDRPFATVYSGVLLAASLLVAAPSDTSLVAHYPARLFGVTQAVAVALVVAAVVTAVSATATVSTRRAVVASAVIGTFLVVDVLVHLGVFGDSYQRLRLTTWGSVLLIGAVPLGLALLADGITRRRLPAFALVTVLAPVVGLVLVLLLPQVVLTALVMITLPISPDHEELLDWALILMWLISGALLGAVALIPQLVSRTRPQPVVVGATPILE